MPVSPYRLVRDEPSRADPRRRKITVVPGTQSLRAALEHADEVGAWGALVVQRSGGGYDLIDLQVVKRAREDPRERAPAVVAFCNALDDPAIAGQPVEDCPAARVSAEVAAEGSISTRDAFSLAAESPLQLLVVVTGSGEFLGVINGSIPFKPIRDYYRTGFLAIDGSLPIGEAYARARQSRLGLDNAVFIRLPNGEWGANSVGVLKLALDKGGADVAVERLPYDFVPACEEDDASTTQAQDIAAEAPGRQLIVLRDGQVAGFVGNPTRIGRPFDEAAMDPRATHSGPPQPRFVNTAFVARDDARRVLGRDTTLRAGARYYFRLDIGAYTRESLAAGRAEDAIPESLLPNLEGGLPLRVLVFNDGFAELEQDRGELGLYPEGPAAVRARAAEVLGLEPQWLDRYLFFGVRASDLPGQASLRASIYFNGNLVQSWRVAAEVTADGEARPGALRAERDFSLTASLKPEFVNALPARAVNILVNDSNGGTHGIFVAGQEGVKASFTITPDQAATAADRYRTRLREAMYQDPVAAKGYLYGEDNIGNVKVLSAALKALADAGYNLFDFLFNQAAAAAGEFNLAKALRKQVLAPANLQCTVRQDGTWIVPWAGVYDYPLVGTQNEWQICDAFLGALKRGADLAQEPCFQGQCPHRGELNTVCASGFWGFRHVIETAPSVADGELALVVPHPNGLLIDMGVSTDPEFIYRQAHTDRLRALPGVGGLQNTETYAAILAMLQKSQAQVVYFYCHGGRSGTTPYLSVDRPDAGKIIRASDVGALDLDWSATRPLVFINGCHTVDLAPEDLLNFAQRFIQVAQASAVLGTEITVMEQFAAEFGEGFLRAFAAGESMGPIMHSLRLKLLQKYNPLGLVYTPYGHAGLRLA